MGLMHATTAALMAAAEHGIPPDVQEVLIYGVPSNGIPPGALEKMVRAAIRGWADDLDTIRIPETEA